MLRNLFCILVAAVWTTIMFTVVCIHMLLRWNASVSLWWARTVWSPVLVWAGGGDLQVSGLENVDFSRPHVFVCNHQSAIDIPAVFMALPVDLRFVAKRALGYIPALGWYLHLARFPLVDRANHRNAVSSLDIAARQIREGCNIVMFAEGTRSDDNRVLPFKKGPFTLAMKAGVPLVPVAIEGSGKLMPKNSWNITPGPIKIRVGTPIDPRPFVEDRDGLVRAVRNAIIDMSLELGGLGGDKQDAVAARGLEGIGKSTAAQAPGGLPPP